MHPASNVPGGRAAGRFAASGEAIVRAIGFDPELDSAEAGWNNLALYAWRGQCEEARFEPFAEPVIVYHVGGARSVRVGVGRNWSRRTHPGLITIIPPATPVAWDIRGEVHSRSVHLGSRFFSADPDIRLPAAALPLRFRCGVQDPLIATAIQTLETEIRRPAELGSLYADAVADTLALHLLRDAVSPPRPAIGARLSPSVLRRCEEQLDASVESGVSLQALADQAGLSRAYFAEAFRRSTGLSPHRALTLRRLARARVLLQNTGLPIAEIALRCGFSNQSHFSDCFRRELGVTPGQFRATPH